MRHLLWLVALGMLVAMGCEATQEPVDTRVDDEVQRVADPAPRGETVVPLGRVPDVALSAAQEAVEGIVFTRAEHEIEGGVAVYDLSGVAGGKHYEVEVTADGKVLDVEEDDGEDDDDDDEDDDDEDDDEDDDGEDDDE